MEQRTLGSSGVSVSAMSVGSWLTLDHIPEDEALDVLRTAIDLGVSFFDDARYDDRTGKAPIKTGYSEVVFGELFRKGGWRREDVFIANKAWLEFYPDETIAEEVMGSLVRLEMDYLDLVYVVPPPKDSELSIAELVEQMNEVVQSGKLRYWGGLNWTAKQIDEACTVASENDYAPFTAVQLPYNLLYRKAVEGPKMRETCQKHEVGIVASFGLAGGLLTNKYASPDGRGRVRIGGKQLAYYRKQGAIRIASKMSSIAEELGMTPAQLALSYCLVGPNVASVLFGATSKEQIRENLSALEKQQKLDDDALRKIRGILKTSAKKKGGR